MSCPGAWVLQVLIDDASIFGKEGTAFFPGTRGKLRILCGKFAGGDQAACSPASDRDLWHW